MRGNLQDGERERGRVGEIDRRPAEMTFPRTRGHVDVASVLRLAWFGGRLFGTLLASSPLVCLAATPQTYDPSSLDNQ